MQFPTQKFITVFALLELIGFNSLLFIRLFIWLNHPKCSLMEKQLRDTDLRPNRERGVGLTGLVLVRSAWV